MFFTPISALIPNMDSQPLVTVWCITYNQANYIKDALEGFLMQQTNFKFIVVIHDDASTDGTSDIVRQYAKDHPDIFIDYIEKENQWNKGGLPHIIQLMNSLYRQSKYIAFCEGDDYWTDNKKLQRQVDFLEANSSYSMCFHSALKKYECEVNSWILCENIEDKDYSATDLFVNWTIPTASILCRKEALDFYANLQNAEMIQNYDIFIILSCAMIGKIRGMHEQMSIYRIQGQGLTYNKEALRRTIMKNPNHFRCLKLNFPIIDQRYINDTISKTYFERALIQKHFKDKMTDFWASFQYNAIRFIKMLMIYVGKSCIKNNFSFQNRSTINFK